MEPQHRFSSSFTFSLLRWSLCALQNRLNSSERSFRKIKETFGSFVRLASLRFLARTKIIRMLQSLAAAEAASVEWTNRKQQFMRRKAAADTIIVLHFLVLNWEEGAPRMVFCCPPSYLRLRHVKSGYLNYTSDLYTNYFSKEKLLSLKPVCLNPRTPRRCHNPNDSSRCSA